MRKILLAKIKELQRARVRACVCVCVCVVYAVKPENLDYQVGCRSFEAYSSLRAALIHPCTKSSFFCRGLK